MPVDKVRGGYKVRSYVTGKRLKRLYKTKAAAERAAATSRRRSQRKRSKNSRRAAVPKTARGSPLPRYRTKNMMRNMKRGKK